MNWTIKYVTGFDLFQVAYEGEASLKEVIQAKQEYLGHKDWRPGMNLLVDLQKTIFPKLESDDFRRNALFNNEHEAEFGFGRIAFLVKCKNDFGVARQIQSYMDMYTNHEIMVFMDEKEALLWLISKHTPKAVSANEIMSGLLG